MVPKVGGTRLNVGELVRCHYRGDGGIVYRVTNITVRKDRNNHEYVVCNLAPHLDPCGQPVTKAHGYKHRQGMGIAWLSRYQP